MTTCVLTEYTVHLREPPALRERICELHSAAGWGYKRS